MKKMKEIFRDLNENLFHYTPGLILILTGLFIAVAQFLVPIALAAFIIILGVYNIKDIKTALNQKEQIPDFRVLIIRRLQTWLSALFP